jgi:leucyl aminopeptidase
LALNLYNFSKYRSKGKKSYCLEIIDINDKRSSDLDKLIDAVNWTKNLINDAAHSVTPDTVEVNFRKLFM